MAFKVLRLLISLLMIKSYICLHDYVIFLKLTLFDTSSKFRIGAPKDQVFGNLFAVVKDINPLQEIVSFMSTFFVRGNVYSQLSVLQAWKCGVQVADTIGLIVGDQIIHSFSQLCALY